MIMIMIIIGSLQTNCELQPGQRLPESESYVMFSPSDPRYPNVLVLRIDLPMAFVEDPFHQKQQIWLLDISSNWPVTSKMGYGMNVRSIGEIIIIIIISIVIIIIIIIIIIIR